MSEIDKLLDESALRRLRATWDRNAMTQATVSVMNKQYAAFAAWNEAVTDAFYSETSPLRPVDRERCLIALLTVSGPPVSLGLHAYAGLMEGISPTEVVHIVGLAAHYRGITRLSDSFPTLRRTFTILQQKSAEIANPSQAMQAILDEFSVAH